MAEELDRLERVLAVIGPEIDFPGAASDLAGAVASRLRTEAGPPRFSVSGLRSRGAFRPVVRPAWHMVAAAAIVILLVVTGTVSLWTPARDAVAGWLGLRGVQIQLLPSPPSASPTATPPAVPLGQDLDLGEPVTIGKAQALATHPLATPTDPARTPHVVYESSTLPGGLVSFVYGARPGLAAGGDGVSVLFMQFRARIDRQILLFKGVGPGTKLQAVRVNGQPGFWLTGEPHGLAFAGLDGKPVFDSQRLAGNVLIWEHGDEVLRLEGTFTKAEALRIARSVR
jgi:hypothetical protein